MKELANKTENGAVRDEKPLDLSRPPSQEAMVTNEDCPLSRTPDSHQSAISDILMRSGDLKEQKREPGEGIHSPQPDWSVSKVGVPDAASVTHGNRWGECNRRKSHSYGSNMQEMPANEGKTQIQDLLLTQYHSEHVNGYIPSPAGNGMCRGLHGTIKIERDPPSDDGVSRVNGYYHPTSQSSLNERLPPFIKSEEQTLNHYNHTKHSTQPTADNKQYMLPRRKQIARQHHNAEVRRNNQNLNNGHTPSPYPGSPFGLVPEKLQKMSLGNGNSPNYSPMDRAYENSRVHNFDRQIPSNRSQLEAKNGYKHSRIQPAGADFGQKGKIPNGSGLEGTRRTSYHPQGSSTHRNGVKQPKHTNKDHYPGMLHVLQGMGLVDSLSKAYCTEIDAQFSSLEEILKVSIRKHLHSLPETVNSHEVSTPLKTYISDE